MTPTTARTISKLAHLAATLVFLIATAFFFTGVVEQVPRAITVGVAVFLLIGAVTLVALYLTMYAVGALDQPVPLGRLVPDAWESVLASTVMVGISWISLAGVVGPESASLRLIAPALLVVTAGLIVHRVYRLRIRRAPASGHPGSGTPSSLP